MNPTTRPPAPPPVPATHIEREGRQFLLDQLAAAGDRVSQGLFEFQGAVLAEARR